MVLYSRHWHGWYLGHRCTNTVHIYPRVTLRSQSTSGKKVLHLASLDRHTPVANERERRKKGARLRRVSDPGPYFWAPSDKCPLLFPPQWPTHPCTHERSHYL